MNILPFTVRHMQAWFHWVGGVFPSPMLGENVASWSKIKKPLDQNWI